MYVWSVCVLFLGFFYDLSLRANMKAHWHSLAFLKYVIFGNFKMCKICFLKDT